MTTVSGSAVREMPSRSSPLAVASMAAIARSASRMLMNPGPETFGRLDQFGQIRVPHNPPGRCRGAPGRACGPAGARRRPGNRRAEDRRSTGSTRFTAMTSNASRAVPTASFSRFARKPLSRRAAEHRSRPGGHGRMVISCVPCRPPSSTRARPAGPRRDRPGADVGREIRCCTTSPRAGIRRAARRWRRGSPRSSGGSRGRSGWRPLDPRALPLARPGCACSTTPTSRRGCR